MSTLAAEYAAAQQAHEEALERETAARKAHNKFMGGKVDVSRVATTETGKAVDAATKASLEAQKKMMKIADKMRAEKNKMQDSVWIGPASAMPSLLAHEDAGYREGHGFKGLRESLLDDCEGEFDSCQQVRESDNPEIEYKFDQKVGDAKLSYTILHQKKQIDLGSVRVPQAKRGKGAASAAMQELNSTADKMGYEIKLGASPLDQKTHLGKLVKFYQKHEFELTGRNINPAGHPEMIRRPKSAPQESADMRESVAFSSCFEGVIVTGAHRESALLQAGIKAALPGCDVIFAKGEGLEPKFTFPARFPESSKIHVLNEVGKVKRALASGMTEAFIESRLDEGLLQTIGGLALPAVAKKLGLKLRKDLERGEYTIETPVGKAVFSGALPSIIAWLEKRMNHTGEMDTKKESDEDERLEEAAGDKISSIDPETMTAGAINKELEKLDKMDSAVTQAFIAAGRGNETPNEYLKADDDLAKRARAIFERRSKLSIEVHMRAGPGRYKLPEGRGFGPRKKESEHIEESAENRAHSARAKKFPELEKLRSAANKFFDGPVQDANDSDAGDSAVYEKGASLFDALAAAANKIGAAEEEQLAKEQAATCRKWGKSVRESRHYDPDTAEGVATKSKALSGLFSKAKAAAEGKDWQTVQDALQGALEHSTGEFKGIAKMVYMCQTRAKEIKGGKTDSLPSMLHILEQGLKGIPEIARDFGKPKGYLNESEPLSAQMQAQVEKLKKKGMQFGKTNLDDYDDDYEPEDEKPEKAVRDAAQKKWADAGQALHAAQKAAKYVSQDLKAKKITKEQAQALRDTVVKSQNAFDDADSEWEKFLRESAPTGRFAFSVEDEGFAPAWIKAIDRKVVTIPVDDASVAQVLRTEVQKLASKQPDKEYPAVGNSPASKQKVHVEIGAGGHWVKVHDGAHQVKVYLTQESSDNPLLALYESRLEEASKSDKLQLTPELQKALEVPKFATFGTEPSKSTPEEKKAAYLAYEALDDKIQAAFEKSKAIELMSQKGSLSKKLLGAVEDSISGWQGMLSYVARKTHELVSYRPSGGRYDQYSDSVNKAMKESKENAMKPTGNPLLDMYNARLSESRLDEAGGAPWKPVVEQLTNGSGQWNYKLVATRDFVSPSGFKFKKGNTVKGATAGTKAEGDHMVKGLLEEYNSDVLPKLKGDNEATSSGRTMEANAGLLSAIKGAGNHDKLFTRPKGFSDGSASVGTIKSYASGLERDLEAHRGRLSDANDDNDKEKAQQITDELAAIRKELQWAKMYVEQGGSMKESVGNIPKQIKISRSQGGWYVEVSDEDGVIADSEKVSFPIDVDAYARHQGDQLKARLLKVYPGARIKESEPGRAVESENPLLRAYEAKMAAEEDDMCEGLPAGKKAPPFGKKPEDDDMEEARGDWSDNEKDDSIMAPIIRAASVVSGAHKRGEDLSGIKDSGSDQTWLAKFKKDPGLATKVYANSIDLKKVREILHLGTGSSLKEANKMGDPEGTTYKIIRFFQDANKKKRVMQTGLTLEEAQAHCKDPSTKKEGVYFDGFEAENKRGKESKPEDDDMEEGKKPNPFAKKPEDDDMEESGSVASLKAMVAKKWGGKTGASFDNKSSAEYEGDIKKLIAAMQKEDPEKYAAEIKTARGQLVESAPADLLPRDIVAKVGSLTESMSIAWQPLKKAILDGQNPELAYHRACANVPEKEVAAFREAVATPYKIAQARFDQTNPHVDGYVPNIPGAGFSARLQQNHPSHMERLRREMAEKDAIGSKGTVAMAETRTFEKPDNWVQRAGNSRIGK